MFGHNSCLAFSRPRASIDTFAKRLINKLKILESSQGYSLMRMGEDPSPETQEQTLYVLLRPTVAKGDLFGVELRAIICLVLLPRQAALLAAVPRSKHSILGAA